ncbi:hypothetical protein B296_00020795 [Ensete ventricosum]|uniref:Uncharacterized protein n=1 Tax=Ensete ventricosum TaxID=4639 RepID=A0A427AZ07_ENSVE|nr:hypothetical protein B296_00020795 [Ensete ventricosum]
MVRDPIRCRLPIGAAPPRPPPRADGSWNSWRRWVGGPLLCVELRSGDGYRVTHGVEIGSTTRGALWRHHVAGTRSWRGAIRDANEMDTGMRGAKIRDKEVGAA